MSRTYRRRKVPLVLIWVLRDYTWINGHIQSRAIDPTSPEGRKALARYHSDSGFGDYGHACPPRGYRRMLNRQADRREEQALHRWRKNPEHEVVLPRRVSNARYFW